MGSGGRILGRRIPGLDYDHKNMSLGAESDMFLFAGGQKEFCFSLKQNANPSVIQSEELERPDQTNL